MKKILVLGSRGMLGHVVYHYIKSLNRFNILDSSFNNKLNPNSHLLDVRNNKDLELFISQNKPDIIINCIGILIEASSIDKSNAIYLNSYLPHMLSKLSSSYNCKLIHISTDCVFSGNKGSYIETDYKDARDIYGLSKGLGEINNNRDLTIRTSIIGPEIKVEGRGLFHWFMLQKKKINGYINVFWSGVTTIELAKAIVFAIDNNTTGLYHITNGRKISKNDLLQLINKHTGKNLIIKPVEVVFSDKSFLDTRKELNYIIPSYEIMIKEMIQMIKQNKKLYTQYNLSSK